MRIVWLDCFPENPSNPARTNMQTGEIEINRSAYSLLPLHTKKFVILHEIGHYKLQTFDECKADDFALKQMALREKYSLRNHVDSVYMLARDDVRRKRHALISVLTIMATLGDAEAIEVLSKIK